MAIGKDRAKIVITVSTDMANRIDLYCQKMGVSRSALCGMLIGQGIMSYDKSFEVVDRMGGTFADAVAKETENVKLANGDGCPGK